MCETFMFFCAYISTNILFCWTAFDKRKFEFGVSLVLAYIGVPRLIGLLCFALVNDQVLTLELFLELY
jgi:hypothetical protein